MLKIAKDDQFCFLLILFLASTIFFFVENILFISYQQKIHFSPGPPVCSRIFTFYLISSLVTTHFSFSSFSSMCIRMLTTPYRKISSHNVHVYFSFSFYFSSLTFNNLNLSPTLVLLFTPLIMSFIPSSLAILIK